MGEEIGGSGTDDAAAYDYDVLGHCWFGGGRHFWRSERRNLRARFAQGIGFCEVEAKDLHAGLPIRDVSCT